MLGFLHVDLGICAGDCITFICCLFQVCNHPHIAMRACGVEAITTLVLAALRHPFQPPLHENTVCSFL